MSERGIATLAIVAVVLVVVVAVGVGYFFIARQPGPSGGDNQPNGWSGGIMYEVYPETDQAPVLEFLWGPPELQPSQITRITPYGCWEGPPEARYEPAVEMQFYTTTSHDPVYTVAKGTVVSIDRSKKTFSIRYGRNYGVTYHHVVDILDNVTVGVKVEAGTLVGYTENFQDEGWWEIELDVKRDNICRTLPPFGYFSAESQTKLQSYLDASPTWNVSGSPRTWTVTTGEDCWTKYFDAPEWWSSLYDRLGYMIENFETDQDFLAANNLTWDLEYGIRPLVAGPDPETDGITYTLPEGASPLRLSLPASVEDIFYNNKTGIGGFGLHAGGHKEGLDHVWIELKVGTPVRSWADGTVTDIELSGDIEAGEYHITIDYGQNLIGIHMEIENALVNVGDLVSRGQVIGYGMSYDPEQSSGEISLVDLGRTDGVKYGEHGVYVSPFDYLENSEKRELVAAYKEHVLEPFENGQSENISIMFKPYQPYLTNQLFLHRTNIGKLSGEWYLATKWEVGYPNDLLTFIEADNPYYQGNVVLSEDDETGGGDPWNINGTFEVDYENGRIKMTNRYGPIYYGIFEIDDSGDRAKLKIEYQEESYPTHFTDNALNYIERTNLSRREDAVQLGVRDSL